MFSSNSNSISSKHQEQKDQQESENKNFKFNSLESIQNYCKKNLEHINSLKSPNYDKLISNCICFDLREGSLSNNNLTESNLNLLKSLYDKLSGKVVCKEKKKKGNRTNKDGMGLLLSLDISEAPLLYNKYREIEFFGTTTYECYLYTIKVKLNTDNNIGFIFPVNLGKVFNIKLINRRERKIFYAVIRNEKKIKLTSEQMNQIVTYHYSLCNQLIKGKKNFENQLIGKFMKNLSEGNKYKKYFFVPLKKFQVEIEENKIKKCFNFIGEKLHNYLFPRISEILPKDIKESDKNKKMVFNLFENAYFVTDYKINRTYRFENILYKDDKLNTFLRKYTFNNEELIKQVKNKILNAAKKHNLDAKNLTAKYIMEELPFEENEPKDLIGGITGFRKIPQKYHIEISKDNNYYLSCKFGSLNVVKKTNFIYNLNILKSLPNKNSKDDSEEMLKDHDKCAKILPPDRIFSYYIDKNDVDFFEVVPSLFINFEELIKIPQFINDYDLLKGKSSKEKKIIERNYNFIQWAFTLHMYLQDYNYETLETLGDSILKMFSTILVYHIHEINDIEMDVGELVFNRATLICNLHLYTIGLENKIYNYLIRYPKEITGYTFPLEHEFITTGKINITEKIVADIVESSIGGIFLCTRNTQDCFNYIRKLQIPFVEEKDSKYEQSKGAFSKDAVWNNKKKYNKLVNQSYDIMGKKLANFGEFIFPEKTSDLLDNDEINQNIKMIELMQNYLLKCNEASEIYQGNNQSLDYLQKCRIFYTFKKVELLEQAMTHKSKYPSFSKNYEKLELLGDSIVEGFISQYTFCIFGPYLFEEDEDIILDNETQKKEALREKNNEIIKKNAKIFNNKYMTHVKSYLCSNYFMCKLSVLIGLPKYIRFGEKDTNNRQKLKKFLEKENMERFWDSNLSDYVSTETYQPKFIADLFEALIGAIYMDSDLKTTYEFLHLIYGPSICYSCLFLKDLPFSIVADFTERCSKEIKIVPSFKNVTKEEIISRGIEYESNKVYLKLTIGDLFSCIDNGDNEEKARENLSEKGITFLDNIKYKGPSKKTK